MRNIRKICRRQCPKPQCDRCRNSVPSSVELPRWAWVLLGCLILALAAIRVCAVEPLVLPIALPGTNIPANVRAECIVKNASPAPVLAVAFSPDGKTLASGGYYEVLLWDLDKATVKRIGTIGERIRALVWSANGKTLFIADGMAGVSGTVRAIDLSSGANTVINDESKDELSSIALNDDGKLLAASGVDGTIRVFSVPEYKAVATLKEHSDRVTAVDFAPDGEHLLGVGMDRLAVVWAVSDWKPVVRLTQPDPICAGRFSPEGDLIAFATVSPTDPALRVVRFNPEAATNTANNAKGRRKQNNAPAARSFDCGTNQAQCLAWTTNAAAAVGRRAVQQNGRRALRLLAGCDSVIKEFTWNGDSGPALSGHSDWIYAMALDSSEVRLATGSGDGTVKIWNVSTGRLLATLATVREPEGWAMITSRGFFSASSPELIDWHIINATRPAPQLRRRLDRPERVAAILSGLPPRMGKEALESNE